MGRIGKQNTVTRKKGTGWAAPRRRSPVPGRGIPKSKYQPFQFHRFTFYLFYFFPDNQGRTVNISHLASLGLINIPLLYRSVPPVPIPAPFNRSTNICIFPYRVGRHQVVNGKTPPFFKTQGFHQQGLACLHERYCGTHNCLLPRRSFRRGNAAAPRFRTKKTLFLTPRRGVALH